MARIILGNKFISAYGIRRGRNAIWYRQAPEVWGNSSSYPNPPHSWISSPGANGWQDGMMAYFGQLLVANIYLLGPLASRMCRSSVWLCALYEKITFAILSTWDLSLGSAWDICIWRLCQFLGSLANGKFPFITISYFFFVITLVAKLRLFIN